MIECMEAALKVSKFTEEEVNALSANQKNIYYSIVSLDTVIEDEMVAQTLDMFNLHSDKSVISRFVTYMYNDRNSRFTYINKGKAMQQVKPEIGNPMWTRYRSSKRTEAMIQMLITPIPMHGPDMKMPSVTITTFRRTGSMKWAAT